MTRLSRSDVSASLYILDARATCTLLTAISEGHTLEPDGSTVDFDPYYIDDCALLTHDYFMIRLCRCQ